MYRSANEALVGKTLTGVSLSSDKETITFHTTEGDVKATCYGGCCSHTWIESVEGPKSGKVIAAADTSLREAEYGGDYECLEFYSLKLTVEGKGYLDIVYRNSANGYYGGSLEF